MTVPVDVPDARIAKAYAHPLRIHILSMLDGETMSPSQIADALDAPLPNVSYHVRQLEQLELVTLERTKQIRGAVEHWYTAAAHPALATGWGENVPAAVRKQLLGTSVEKLGAHVTAGATEGGFEREGAHLDHSSLLLDEKGWEAVARELERSMERVLKVAAEARERVEESDDDGFKATLASVLFVGPAATAGLPENAGIRRHKRRRNGSRRG